MVRVDAISQRRVSYSYSMDVYYIDVHGYSLSLPVRIIGYLLDLAGSTWLTLVCIVIQSAKNAIFAPIAFAHNPGLSF